MKESDARLIDLIELELDGYVDCDEAGLARQAARQVVAAVRLAEWAPIESVHPMPAEEEREGSR